MPPINRRPSKPRRLLRQRKRARRSASDARSGREEGFDRVLPGAKERVMMGIVLLGKCNTSFASDSESMDMHRRNVFCVICRATESGRSQIRVTAPFDSTSLSVDRLRVLCLLLYSQVGPTRALCTSPRR